MSLFRLLKKRPKTVIILITVLISGIIFFYELEKPTNTYKVRKNKFEYFIACKGEIQSEKAVLINYPEALADPRLGIYQAQIKDLVPEGTVVRKGDFVATLDQGRIKQMSESAADFMRRQQSDFNSAKLDSAITLSGMRDELEQLAFDLNYKKIDVEQSMFDSPASQRRAQIEYDRTVRLIDSKKRSYQMRRSEMKVRCERSERQLNDIQERNEKYQKALDATRVTAPGNGMIIYARKWGNRKTKVDDYVSYWDPIIATLPDLSSMVSETYVEEIYISKIKVGDSVRVYIDALKNKEILGCIANISNIGQEMQGFDSNVFKVYVKLSGDLSKLKPSMTTNNQIIIESYENVLTIPLNTLFSESGKEFVYVKQSGKITKRNVTVGSRNDKVAYIKSGLKENDIILTSKPKNV
jgi:multidrug efflux pump subunit AcrA (membrane-fusion protein)